MHSDLWTESESIGRHRQKAVQSGPTLANFAPNWGNIALNLVESGPKSARFGMGGPNFDECGVASATTATCPMSNTVKRLHAHSLGPRHVRAWAFRPFCWELASHDDDDRDRFLSRRSFPLVRAGACESAGRLGIDWLARAALAPSGTGGRGPCSGTIGQRKAEELRDLGRWRGVRVAGVAESSVRVVFEPFVPTCAALLEMSLCPPTTDTHVRVAMTWMGGDECCIVGALGRAGLAAMCARCGE